MCSPAQFRQQSAELYATIDEVLADSRPTVSVAASAACLTCQCQREDAFQLLCVSADTPALQDTHPHTRSAG